MKTPYLQLKIEVDKLYDKKLDTSEQIEEHFEFIKEYIIANGWCVNEYTSKTLQKYNPETLN